MNVLVTGGLGFIGSNLIRRILRERPAWRVVNLDLVTYAANPANLADIVHDPLGTGGADGDAGSHAGGGARDAGGPAAGASGGGAAARYRFVRGDVADRALVAELFAEEAFDAVVHCAAESHVDRSIDDGGRFLETNVGGTLVLLEAALRADAERGADGPEGAAGQGRPMAADHAAARDGSGGVRFLQMGTDEVYGTLRPDDPPFTERTPLAPRSPYSASKAAADQMALAFHHTHGLDVVVTRCSNNYGPYQHPEKLVPLMITSALRGRPLPVYGDGRQRRDWIHVADHCRGVLMALEAGRSGAVYNFGGGAERENIAVVRRVVEAVGASEDLITFVADRPGHDRRYSVSYTRAERELGWRPERDFEAGLRQTVRWYRRHEAWWRRVADEAYDDSRERIAAWADGG